MTRINAGRRAALAVSVAVAIASGGIVAGCGDDEEEPAASGEESAATEETTESTPAEETEGEATEVELTATEYDFELSATPTAETTSVTATNDGKEFHVVVFARINEGFTLDEALEAEGEKGTATEMIKALELPPGETATAEVTETIEPGSYVLLCPIGGPKGTHAELGQLEEFEIE